MAIPEQGPQHRIWPFLFELELIAYLETKGFGTARKTLWHDRFPAEPIEGTLIVSDQVPIDSRDPASHPSFRILVRGLEYTATYRKAHQILGLLHHRQPELTSFDVFVTANHEPGHYYDDHQHPIVFVGYATTGMVKCA